MVDSFQPFEAGVQLNFSEDTSRGSRLRKKSLEVGERQAAAAGRGLRVGVWMLGLGRGRAELPPGVPGPSQWRGSGS